MPSSPRTNPRRAFTWGTFALLAMLVSGCAVENPPALRDTTGAEIGWTCDYGGCTTVQEAYSPPVPPDCGDGTEHLVGAGAIANLCDVTPTADGDLVHERTCRPLACADELDCPQWEERAYACLSGICQAQDGLALDRVDLSALCLYDLPRPTSCAEADADPEVTRRIALVDAACSSGTCASVPAGCLSP